MRSRYHHGLIAQEVESVITDSGVDFGGFQNHEIGAGEDVMSLGYSEFIAPMIKAIQELTEKVSELEKNNIKEKPKGNGEKQKIVRARLPRGKEILGDVRIKTMKKGKEDTNSVVLSEEFGIIFSPELDFKIGDVLISYRKSEA